MISHMWLMTFFHYGGQYLYVNIYLKLKKKKKKYVIFHHSCYKNLKEKKKKSNNSNQLIKVVIEFCMYWELASIYSAQKKGKICNSTDEQLPLNFFDLPDIMAPSWEMAL